MAITEQVLKKASELSGHEITDLDLTPIHLVLDEEQIRELLNSVVDNFTEDENMLGWKRIPLKDIANFIERVVIKEGKSL